MFTAILIIAEDGAGTFDNSLMVIGLVLLLLSATFFIILVSSGQIRGMILMLGGRVLLGPPPQGLIFASQCIASK